MLLVMILNLAASFMLYGYFYLKECYDDVTLFELVYYAKMPLKGGNKGPFLGELPRTIAIIFGSLIYSASLFSLLRHMGFTRGFVMAIGSALALLIIAADTAVLCRHFHVGEFLKLHRQYSDLYEKEYVDPRKVKLTFPEKKRNLIYIMLESMETCYHSETGDDFIPELASLAREGADFSEDEELGGAYAVPGATFTTGAMIAHMAGISVDLAIKEDERFIPGMCTIGDILASQGYEQVFMLGSDAVFGARDAMMQQHGNYRIFDYRSAQRDGHIPEDYYIWWGFEDEKLFDFAKKELKDLASKDKPFNLTLLTVDTHFLNGCPCRLCQKKFREQYGNVLACSSRQVSGFIDWIKQQDFYKDTAIVLCGDHPTMDSGFIKRSHLTHRERKAYVSFMNVPGNLKERPRRYTTTDLFPTTLRAMGVEIEGDRLGLGTDLFSERETLLESMGAEKLGEEFTKRSKFYRDELLP